MSKLYFLVILAIISVSLGCAIHEVKDAEGAKEIGDVKKADEVLSAVPDSAPAEILAELAKDESAKESAHDLADKVKNEIVKTADKVEEAGKSIKEALGA